MISGDRALALLMSPDKNARKLVISKTSPEVRKQVQVMVSDLHAIAMGYGSLQFYELRCLEDGEEAA